MLCPKCSTVELNEVHTRQGVVVDHCPTCKGVWLDDGEIYLFSREPKWLNRILEKGLHNPHSVEGKCPRCEGTSLQEGNFGDSDLLLDQCPSCQGLWFDDGELRKALDLGKKKFQMEMSEDRYGLLRSDQKENRQRWETSKEKEQKLSALRAGVIGLPNLAVRSAFSFVLLYGFLFLALFAVGEVLGWPVHLPAIISVAFLFLQYLIGPWILDISLSWLYTSRRVGIESLPDHLSRFIQRVCREKNMKVPQMIIIEDGAPNAFTYGRTPNDARVVLTQGIFNYLEPDEVEAVVAHEIGHARHWDILVMVLASMVPILLYYLYRACMDASRSRSSKNSGGVAIIGLGAYILYIIAEYIVLWLSRTREYWADRFSGTMTGNPNALSRALVKIAYGLVEAHSDKGQDKQKKEERSRSTNLEALNMFGIFDMKMAKSLALNSFGTGHGKVSDTEKATSAMQWDLWNPWAHYYEIHSTHPLPAKRIDALCDQAAAMGQEPYLVFNRQKPESYWDEFFVDVFVYFLPLYPLLAAVGFFLAGFENVLRLAQMVLIATGFFLLLRTLLCYRGSVFPHTKVSSLLSKVKVSEVRPVPVTLKGKIVGKGVPGYIFSEDVVLQDDTGIIFLDYRQPLRIFEFLFAIFRTNKYVGQEVIATGWYRRTPTPYVEIKSMSMGSKVAHCYVYQFKIAFAFMVIAAGIYWLVA